MTTSSSPSDVLTEQGIAELRAGERLRALEFLGNALHIDPNHERAWLWASGAVIDNAERVFCLKRVLAINPRNEAAQRGLMQLPANIQPHSPFRWLMPEPVVNASAPSLSISDGSQVAVPPVEILPAHNSRAPSVPMKRRGKNQVKGCLVWAAFLGLVIVVFELIVSINQPPRVQTEGFTATRAAPTSRPVQPTMQEPAIVAIPDSPTATPDQAGLIQATLNADQIRDPYAIALATLYMREGFRFTWRTAPNGTPIYQAGYKGDIVVTLTRPDEIPFGGAAIAIPLSARPGSNAHKVALMHAMLETFPEWEDGRDWIDTSMRAWSDSLRKDAVPEGLYEETRGKWHAELFYMNPELVILSVEPVMEK